MTHILILQLTIVPRQNCLETENIDTKVHAMKTFL